MISVLVPSRHRPELAKRLLDTINNTKTVTLKLNSILMTMIQPLRNIKNYCQVIVI